MARPKLAGELGDKLGPKLAQLSLAYSLAARRALGPHEARIRQAATQALIDRAGAEAADHFRPLLAPLLRGDHGPVHPDMHAHLSRAVAGTHQWHSLSSLLGMGVQSALSNAISNAVAPISYEINKTGPNLNADAQVWAAGVAAGLASFGTGQDVAHKQGLGGQNFGLMVELAEAIPDAGTLGELVNRGIITEAEADQWMHRAAVPAALRDQIIRLRHALISPADAALAVLRGNIGHTEAETIARHNGLDPAQFGILVANTGEPLGLEQLAEALRRGFIDRARFARGLRESRVRNEWLDVAEALRYSPVPSADAIDAHQRGHITADRAREIAEQNGIEPTQVQILLDNAGNPPAPEQLLFLLRRGKLTRARVEDGIRQGRTRDEWISAILDLEYEPISTADAIDSWLRGHIDTATADRIAVQNGTEPDQVQILRANAGNPLGLVQLLDAYRRGIIDRATFERGFRESRYRPEWAETALRLRHSPASTADAIEASVQGHITRERAAAIAEDNGLDPADFGFLWQTAGEPLSRTEMSQLYNRGLATREEFAQALRESRLKDKYVDQAIDLHVREPQPREVVAGITDGVITREQGMRMLREQGYSREVAAMLVAEGEVHSTGPHRQLMTAQVSALYADRIVNREQAAALLERLHYTRASAELVLDMADHNAQRKILDSGIAMIKAHYVAHRITAVAARADLLALRLPPASVDLYMRTWSFDRLANPRQLTAAQIVKAANKGLLVRREQLTQEQWTHRNQEAGHARLVQLGYSGDDASLLLAGA